MMDKDWLEWGTQLVAAYPGSAAGLLFTAGRLLGRPLERGLLWAVLLPLLIARWVFSPSAEAKAILNDLKATGEEKCAEQVVVSAFYIVDAQGGKVYPRAACSMTPLSRRDKRIIVRHSKKMLVAAREQKRSSDVFRLSCTDDKLVSRDTIPPAGKLTGHPNDFNDAWVADNAIPSRDKR